MGEPTSTMYVVSGSGVERRKTNKPTSWRSCSAAAASREVRFANDGVFIGCRLIVVSFTGFQAAAHLKWSELGVCGKFVVPDIDDIWYPIPI